MQRPSPHLWDCAAPRAAAGALPHQALRTWASLAASWRSQHCDTRILHPKCVCVSAEHQPAPRFPPCGHGSDCLGSATARAAGRTSPKNSESLLSQELTTGAFRATGSAATRTPGYWKAKGRHQLKHRRHPADEAEDAGGHGTSGGTCAGASAGPSGHASRAHPSRHVQVHNHHCGHRQRTPEPGAGGQGADGGGHGDGRFLQASCRPERKQSWEEPAREPRAGPPDATAQCIQGRTSPSEDARSL